jgi:lipid A 3-O-deacylase
MIRPPAEAAREAAFSAKLEACITESGQQICSGFGPGKGSTLSRLTRCMLLVWLGLGLAGIISAQAPDAPVNRRWELGPFVQGGTGVGDRSDFQFFALGFQAGRRLSPVVHAGPLTGDFEMGVNVMPFWQAYTPAPHTQIVNVGDGIIIENIGGGTFTGASITPVIFRWNFRPESQRFMPWFQAQGAVLYTTHKFPPTVEVPEGTPGGTSVWNFRSGAGIGFHYFTRPKRSIDFALNAEHISSASLGDRNPGVNASLQFQLGYSWWK